MKKAIFQICALATLFGFEGTQANAATIWRDCSKINTAIVAHDIKTVESILFKDALFVECNSNGPRPIFTAAKSGDVPVLKMLVAYGANINDQMNESAGVGNFIFPIHWAAEFNTKEVLAFLLELGADVDALDQRGETALMRSFNRAKFDNALELLNGGANPNLETKYGTREAVSRLIQKGDLAFIKVMKSFGADFVTPYRSGSAPIHDAIFNRSIDKLKLIISYGADIETKIYGEGSPLLLAVTTRAFDCFVYLLDLGADPKKESEYQSIMSLAAQPTPDPRFIEAALNRGLPLTWVDRHGIPLVQGFLSIARNNNISKPEIEMSLIDFAQSMHKRGYNFQTYDPLGNLPIHYVAVRGTTLNLVNAFANSPYSGCESTKSGSNLMHLLAQSNGAGASEIDVMLARGCSLSNVDSTFGRAPLHFAAANLNGKMLRALLEKKVHSNRLDNKGYAPLHLIFAETKSYDAQWVSPIEVAAKELKTYGADLDAVTSNGDTSFHLIVKLSVQRGEWETPLLSAMVRLGMDINKPNKNNVTPLKLAKLLGAPENLIDSLIRNGGKE